MQVCYTEITKNTAIVQRRLTAMIQTSLERKMDKNNFFTASDGAALYYEDLGSGVPFVLMPGFLATTIFFQKNIEALSKKYRVIVFDPRGQGRSCKVSGGNTVARNAMDIRDLIEHLRLEEVILGGWSMASSVVVSYARMTNEAHLKGLVLIDGSLFPLSPEPWNKHRSRNYNIDNWLDNYMPLCYNRLEFYDHFIDRIANGAMSEEDRGWVLKEFMKTPPWSALEFHYDFCQTDNFSNLHKLTVPVSLFGGASESYGLEMVEAFAKEIKGYAEVNKFYQSGHMLFYYEAEKFNECISRFIDHVTKMGKEHWKVS